MKYSFLSGKRPVLLGFLSCVLVLQLMGGAGVALAHDLPVTLCHQEGNGGYHTITVSTEGALHGHYGHEGDIIPAPVEGCDGAEAVQADLGITKTVDEPLPNIGGSITYTLSVINYGPDDAVGVLVTDVLPQELIFIAADPTAEYDNTTGVWTIGNLANGATVHLDIYAKAKLEAGDTAPVNTATVSSETEDPNTDNNTASATVEIGIPVTCVHASAHATGVFYAIAGTTKDGSLIADASLTDPNKTLGAPDNAAYAIGKNGRIKLSFTGYVVNTAGTDIVVHELTNSSSEGDEQALVEVSQDGDTWATLGTASNGMTSFDLSVTGLQWIQYVRLIDTTDFAGQGDAANGFDLDAVDISYLLYCDGLGGVGGNQTPTGSITGVVFNDVNANGVKDEGEEQLSGWVVYIDANDNGILDEGEISKTTASPYLFEHLADGVYTIREVLKSGWEQTLPSASYGYKYIVTITNGCAVTDKDFGNHKISAAGGSGGGSSTGGSSAGNGSAPTGNGAAPTGQVLGGTTGPSTPPPSDEGQGGAEPTPQVLGATTLPRTGTGVLNAVLLLTLMLGIAIVLHKTSTLIKR